MTDTMTLETAAGGAYVAPRVTSVQEALDRMAALQEYIDTCEPRRGSDGVGCFNHLYTVITQRVREGIEGGLFADPEFLTVLDVAFANRYFDALRASVQQPSAVPKAWKVLVERRSDDRVESIQFAVAGVNAHINLDLAVAVLETCEQLGNDPGHGSYHDDYEKVNDIFAEEMRSLRQFYEDDQERRVDNLAAPVLDVVGSWSVDAAREAAWVVSEQLWTLRNFDIVLHPFVERIDKLAALAGHLILTPVR